MKWIEVIAEKVFNSKIGEVINKIGRHISEVEADVTGLKNKNILIDNDCNVLAKEIKSLSLEKDSINSKYERIDPFIRNLNKEDLDILMEHKLKISKQLISSDIVKLNDALKELNTKICEIDKVIASLESAVNSKLMDLEESTNHKVVGVYKDFNNKLSKNNGNTMATAGLLKRIAFLEGIKDSSEHRRSTKEIIERKENFKKRLLALDRNDVDYARFQDAIEIIDWVLGKKEVKNA